jgi:uncharacterized caspase-like protein
MAAAERSLSSIRIYVDGRLTKTLAASGSRNTLKVEIPDPGGGRWVSAVAVDTNGILSLPSAIQIPGSPRAHGILRAVVMGVDTYEDKKLRHLKFAQSDARKIADALKKRKGLGVQDVIVTKLDDSKISAETVLTILDAAATATDVDDTLLFFYSGHGLDGRFLGQPQTGWSLTTPTTRLTDLEHTAVTWSSLSAAFAKSRGRVIAILDACHAGAAADAVFATNEDMIRVLTGNNRPMVVLAASKGRQMSYEDAHVGGGVFTAYLSDAISRDNPKGLLDLAKLYREVKSQVLRAKNGQQTPWLVRNALVGEMALF